MSLDVEAAERALVDTVGGPLGMSGVESRERHPPARQRPHGRRDARDPQRGGAEPRRPLGDGLRRRRPAARLRAGARDGHPAHDRPAPPGRAVRPRRRHRRSRARPHLAGDEAARRARARASSRRTSRRWRPTGARILAAEGVPEDRTPLRAVLRRPLHRADARPPGAAASRSTRTRPALAARFHRRHREAYGISVEHEPVLVISARMRAIGGSEARRSTRIVGRPCAEPEREVSAWFDDGGWTPTPVFERAPWQPGVGSTGRRSCSSTTRRRSCSPGSAGMRTSSAR